jgi:hypothetical protein
MAKPRRGDDMSPVKITKQAVKELDDLQLLLLTVAERERLLATDKAADPSAVGLIEMLREEVNSRASELLKRYQI